jgi:hypothetical protein
MYHLIMWDWKEVQENSKKVLVQNACITDGGVSVKLSPGVTRVHI